MTFETIINQMGIELLLFAACMFFGIRLIITRDVHILSKKEDPANIKHPREYTLYAGLVIIFLGVAAIIMGIISFFNPKIALAFIVIAVVAMGIAWKFIYEKFVEGK